MERIILRDLVGDKLEEDFLEFDFTEIQLVLSKLKIEDPIDLSHAEMLQQQALRGADIVSEYLGKIVKTTGYLETKVNSTKNRISLEYQATDGSRTTSEMKKCAGESSPEVEKIQIELSKAKGSKVLLEKKYDILIRSHHHYKDIAGGLRKGMINCITNVSEKCPEGY